GRVAILPDVYAEDASITRARHVAPKLLHALVVEAHPVDDCARTGQAEHAWSRIAWLRARRDGADFEETEAQGCQRIDVAAVLVQAGSQSNRIGEAQAHHGAGRSRCDPGQQA